jgi:glycogen synthase
MKILFLSNLYPPNAVGGYERLCFEIASGLSARNHQVRVLTSSYGGKVEDFPGQVVDRTLKLFATDGDIYQPFDCSPEERTAMSAHNVSTLGKVVDEFNPDVIFAWNLLFFDQQLLNTLNQIPRPLAYLLTDNWLIAILNAPFIQDFFARGVLSKPSFLENLYLSAKLRLHNLIKPNLSLPGYAIFASCFMEDLYAKAGFRFKGKTIIYHGVNLASHPRDSFASRNHLVNQGELRLLFAGRVVEIKGVHLVLEALPLIIRGLPNLKVKLTIQGDDRDRPYLKRLKDRIAELGLDDAIEFVKPVAESELFNVFQSHDIYLFPSLYEPFSLTLIHALAAGIPTVASNVGGNPEIVHQMQTGMLFPPAHIQRLADAVIQLAKDGQRRQAISEKARSVANTYTFKKMLTEVERYLENIQ